MWGPRPVATTCEASWWGCTTESYKQDLSGLACSQVPSIFRKHLSRISNIFWPRTMQNDEVSSTSLLPSSMTSNKAVSCKDWPQKKHITKAEAGGLLMLVSQKGKKMKTNMGIHLPLGRTWSCIHRENHFRGTGWKISSDPSLAKISLASPDIAHLA